MPPRRSASRPDGGELSQYSQFRDKLLLALAAVAVSLMGYFVHQAQTQVDTLRTEIRELRDRLNSDGQESAAFRAGQVVQGAEMIRRLNAIDGKVDGLSKPAHPLSEE